MPITPGNYKVAPISTFDTEGKITGASYNSTTKEIALTGYLEKHGYPFIWLLNGYKEDQFFSRKINV